MGSLSLLQGSSQPRDRTQVSCVAADSLPAEPQGKPNDTGVGSLSLLQQIFLTQELNQGLLHCWKILLPTELSGKPHLTCHIISSSCLQSVFLTTSKVLEDKSFYFDTVVPPAPRTKCLAHYRSFKITVEGMRTHFSQNIS